MRYTLTIIAFLVITSLSLHAQNTDNITWSSIQFTKSLNEKNSISLKPIIRHHQDISKYQNFSLDASYRRQLGKGWYAQTVTRYWWMPQATNRFFLWFDLGYVKKIKKSKLSGHVRYHHAYDIKKRIDPDFLRVKAKWTFPSIGKFTPEFAIEPFYRVNGINKIQRMRYEPGINYKINDKISFSAVYRRENSANQSTESNFNVGVFNLSFRL